MLCCSWLLLSAVPRWNELIAEAERPAEWGGVFTAARFSVSDTHCLPTLFWEPPQRGFPAPPAFSRSPLPGSPPRRPVLGPGRCDARPHTQPARAHALRLSIKSKTGKSETAAQNGSCIYNLLKHFLLSCSLSLSLSFLPLLSKTRTHTHTILYTLIAGGET